MDALVGAGLCQEAKVIVMLVVTVWLTNMAVVVEAALGRLVPLQTSNTLAVAVAVGVRVVVETTEVQVLVVKQLT